MRSAGRAATRLAAVAVTALATAWIAPDAPRAASASRNAEIFRSYRDNIVAITYTLRPKERPTGGEGRKVEDALCGVLVGPDGLVMTSADPFPDPGGDPKTTLVPVEFKVHLRGGRPLEADAVGLDRDLNLAYLRLRETPPAVRAIPFARDPSLDVGDEVLVLGVMSKNYDYEPILYTGMINAVVRRPRLMYSLDLHVQDLTIGGLAVTGSGEPIGIIGEDVLKDPPSSERMPANILSIFGSLTQGRRVGYPMIFPFAVFASGLASPPPVELEEKRSWLGIVMQPLNEDLIEYWRLEVKGGIIISSVVDGSPAAQAGLKPADILVSLQGEPLGITQDEDLSGFRRRIERLGVGSNVELEYLREGRRSSVALTLAEAPQTALTAEEYEDDDLGLTVREITLDDLLGQNLEPTTRGVVVSELERAGWTQLAGLQIGDIIQSIDGRPVVDLDSYRTQSQRLRGEQPGSTLFFVLRQTETLFVRVRTSWEGAR